MADDLIVIADAGPLIGLALIEEVRLLHVMFRRVLVPPAVWSEVTGNSAARGAATLLSATFIEVEEPSAAAIEPFRERLDEGEAQALALAKVHPEALLLIDDLEARKVARSLRLRFTGTVGILIEARRAGHVALLRPLLDALVANGIYLSEELISRAVADVNEK